MQWRAYKAKGLLVCEVMSCWKLKPPTIHLYENVLEVTVSKGH